MPVNALMSDCGVAIPCLSILRLFHRVKHEEVVSIWGRTFEKLGKTCKVNNAT